MCTCTSGVNIWPLPVDREMSPVPCHQICGNRDRPGGGISSTIVMETGEYDELSINLKQVTHLRSSIDSDRGGSLIDSKSSIRMLDYIYIMVL